VAQLSTTQDLSLTFSCFNVKDLNFPRFSHTA